MALQQALPSIGTNDWHVLIIGAGATGLLIAHGLKQAKIPFSIYDGESEELYRTRPRDWSMSLHWGREFVKQNLPSELWDRFEEAETMPKVTISKEEDSVFPLINGKTGEIITMVDAGTTRRVSRKRLKNLFSEGLQIQRGKRLSSMAEDNGIVTAFFSDGTHAVGNMLVGCDSVSSDVRAQLLPPALNVLEPMPIIVYNFTQTFTTEQAIYLKNFGHPCIKYGVHPDQRGIFVIFILEIPNESDPSSWVFQIMFDLWGSSTHLSTSSERVQNLKKHGMSYCEPFRSIAAWVKDDTKILPDVMRHLPKLTKWPNHNGHITLAGDAAHPMVAYRGQGLNNGMQDAANYVTAVKQAFKSEREVKEVIDEYDEEVFERGRKEIEISHECGVAYHDWERLLASPVVTNGFKKMIQEDQRVEAAQERARF